MDHLSGLYSHSSFPAHKRAPSRGPRHPWSEPCLQSDTENTVDERTSRWRNNNVESNSYMAMQRGHNFPNYDQDKHVWPKEIRFPLLWSTHRHIRFMLRVVLHCSPCLTMHIQAEHTSHATMPMLTFQWQISQDSIMPKEILAWFPDTRNQLTLPLSCPKHVTVFSLKVSPKRQAQQVYLKLAASRHPFRFESWRSKTGVLFTSYTNVWRCSYRQRNEGTCLDGNHRQWFALEEYVNERSPAKNKVEFKLTWITPGTNHWGVFWLERGRPDRGDKCTFFPHYLQFWAWKGFQQVISSSCTRPDRIFWKYFFSYFRPVVCLFMAKNSIFRKIQKGCKITWPFLPFDIMSLKVWLK